MKLRLAKTKDLPQLKVMYDKIIENMYSNNIKIWNEFYPYEVFKEDIEKKNLYLLMNNDEIVAAFVLYETTNVENNLCWKNNQKKSIYISRVGVNVNYLRQGIGGMVIKEAIMLAKKKGTKYLRLLVVETNEPAIKLYLKNGFKQVNGINKELIDDITLIEYGFEIEIS